jgi:pyrimidine-nucleoside phosphorylase
MSFNPVEIIRHKRDGQSLSSLEIEQMIGGYARGEVPDYQMSALAMAIFFRGMDRAETTELTRQMLLSGTTLRWRPGSPLVDKHSTGGVGDKVSLVLAPLLACCDLRVPMISGRGLGATGGTLDKLEAIPGFRTNLSVSEMTDVCDRVGCVITGATAELAPADKKLYALRDVTATVASIPLITASILSKKLAEGLDALVLDIKWGSGAFMKRLDDARQLAESLVGVGNALGLKTTALLTDMNQPLGRMVGHAVEVQESLAALAGQGPTDLHEITLALGAELLIAAGIEKDESAARAQLSQVASSGQALERFREMVVAQSGDPDAPLKIAPPTTINASTAGYVASIDAEALGRAVAALGGGRQKLGDTLDLSVGLEMLVRIGDRVDAGQPLVRMFANDRGKDTAKCLIIHAIALSADQSAVPQLIVDRLN